MPYWIYDRQAGRWLNTPTATGPYTYAGIGPYMNPFTSTSATSTMLWPSVTSSTMTVYASPTAAALNQLNQYINSIYWQQNLGDAQMGNHLFPTPPRPLSAPAVRTRRRPPPEEERRLREVQERADLRNAADQKALRLLLTHLDEKQRKEFEDKGSFVVMGQSGQHYRIFTNAISGNVHLIGKKEKLCAHMGQEIPTADHFLAQKLMLEIDEQAFLRIANRSAVYS